jgi:hypothetical protein
MSWDNTSIIIGISSSGSGSCSGGSISSSYYVVVCRFIHLLFAHSSTQTHSLNQCLE